MSNYVIWSKKESNGESGNYLGQPIFWTEKFKCWAALSDATVYSEAEIVTNPPLPAPDGEWIELPSILVNRAEIEGIVIFHPAMIGHPN